MVVSIVLMPSIPHSADKN